MSSVVWSMSSDKRSWTCVRLFWLGERNPRRVPGAFRFPFGPVRCMGAGVMLSLYREIFLDCGYEVVGLGDAPVILDCGGNIGMGVIWFKQRYPRARITVFEADPQTADLLEENVRALGLTSVTVVRAAVSDAAGKVSFVPEGSLGGHVGDGPGVLVDAVRLSDLITEPVDYLKVDGSEFGVLKDLCATGKMGWSSIFRANCTAVLLCKTRLRNCGRRFRKRASASRLGRRGCVMHSRATHAHAVFLGTEREISRLALCLACVGIRTASCHERRRGHRSASSGW